MIRHATSGFAQVPAAEKQARVASAFGRAALTYDNSAVVQKQAAELLACELSRIAPAIPEGLILELGCGTGLFTRNLSQCLPDRRMLISDISSDMLRICQSRFQSPLIEFALIDASWFGKQDSGDRALIEKRFGLVCAAFAAQWFDCFGAVFSGIFNALHLGGYLLFSMPTDHSFPEWKSVCKKARISYTANDLPGFDEIEEYCRKLSDDFVLRQEQITTSHKSAAEFFRSLKRIGASVSSADWQTSGSDAGSLRRLIRKWDQACPEGVSSTYDVAYGWLRRTE